MYLAKRMIELSQTLEKNLFITKLRLLCHVIMNADEEDFADASQSVTISTSPQSPPVNVLVPIINDEALEERETFTVRLSLGEEEERNILLIPTESTVSIFDDDCKFS